MNDRTEINSDIRQSTIVNPDLAAVSYQLTAGSMIAGKYEIMEPLSLSTGEADLYICKYNGKEYVAKMYRRKRAVKPEVLTALQSIDSPYIASLYDVGEYLSAKGYVSRVHAKLVLEEGDLHIENMSNTNFTYVVNNEKILVKTKLQDGDEVGLGGMNLNGVRQEQAAYFQVRIEQCM